VIQHANCDLSAAQIASLAAYHRQGFTYDKLGNRLTLSEPRDDATTTYTYDNVTNELATINSVSVTYDAAGNQTADHRGYTYAYDYENRLIEITEGETTIAEFTYDALGRRIVKVDSIASETTRYHYNADWQVLCEKDDTGDTQRWFVYGNYIDEVLLMVDTTGQSDVDYYYTSDHLYSPAALLDDTGDVLERYEYDAYGELRYLDADFTTKASQSSAYDNPYYFTGRRLDTLDNGDLKLQHNRHRTYDPETGRWLTQDPIGYKDGMNLYQYAMSAPIRFSDPYGLFNDHSGVKELKGPDWRGMAAESLRQAEEIHKGSLYYEKGNTGLQGFFSTMRQTLQQVGVRGGIFLSWSDMDASYATVMNTISIRIDSRDPLQIVHELVHALDDRNDWYIRPGGTDEDNAEKLAQGTERLLERVTALQEMENVDGLGHWMADPQRPGGDWLDAIEQWVFIWQRFSGLPNVRIKYPGGKSGPEIGTGGFEDIESKLGLRFKCVELRGIYENYLKEHGVCLPIRLPCNGMEHRIMTQLPEVFGPSTGTSWPPGLL